MIGADGSGSGGEDATVRPDDQRAAADPVVERAADQLAIPVYRPGRLARELAGVACFAAAVGAGGWALQPAGATLGVAGLGVAVALGVLLVLLAWRGWRRVDAGWPWAAAAGVLGGAGEALYVSHVRGSLSWPVWSALVVAGLVLGSLAGWLADRPRPAPVAELAGYRVEGLIGSGASGSVYRALDAHGQRVAIKVLQESWVGDAEFRRRLRAEAEVMRSLQHPNCVRVYEVIDTPQVAALVTEYVDGATLKRVLARVGRLSGPQTAKVLSGALRGLAHVHGRGLIHGDVKPANICVDRSGTSRLLDFGLARPPAAGGEITGSPAYMSPEQITGGQLDERSDVYSCGVVLFELLTGQRPYGAVDPGEVLAAHLSAPVPDPAAAHAGIPRQLAAVAVTALAKQPSARPPTADRFRELLEQAAEREYGLAWTTVSLIGLAALGDSAAGTGTADPPHSEERAQRGRRRRPSTRSAASAAALVFARPRRSARRRVLAVVSAGAALVAILGTAIGVHRRHPPTPKVPLASCLIGSWGWAGGSFEDVWDGTPVRVRYPPSARPETIRYQADGRYTDSFAAGTPPATGVLHGAVFIHQTYGTDTGRWQVIGTGRIARTDTGSGATTILYAGYQHASSPGFALQSGAVPLSLRCNQSSMTVIDNFTYHGRLLSSSTTYHRQAGGLPGSPAFPDASGVLGGVDVDAYCQQVMHGQRAVLVKPLTGPGAAAGNWACALGNAARPLSYADACQWAYPDHLAVTARAVDPNAAYSWLCFGGPLRRLRITPSSGGVGTAITVSSIDPCPSGTRALTVQLVQAPAQDGIQTGGVRPLAGGGAWRVQLSVGPFGGTAPRIPPGTATVQAYCLLPGNRYVGYQPAPFHFTGHP